MRVHFIALLLLLFLWNIIFSQDNLYNTQQFGARSAMLGGAVVAGVNDNSAVYYNPAALAFIDNKSLSVNANLYQVAIYKVRDAAGEGIDLKATRFSLFPTMLSGMVSFKKNPRFVGSYALITRHFGNEKGQIRYESFYDIYPEVDIEQEFIGSFEYENRIFEQWGGFGIGYRINDNWSAGITQFLSYRSHVNKSYAFTRAILSDSSEFLISSISDQYDIVLDEFRLLWKAGLHFRKNKWKLGLSLITPSLNVVGWANVSREISVYNLIVVQPDTVTTIDLLALDRQRNLHDTRYKVPFSFSFGIEKTMNKGTLMFSVEYFQKLKRYQVVAPNPEPFLRPSTYDYSIDEKEFLSVVYAANTVVNFGLGYEHDISENLAILTSFRTDFNALTEKLEPQDEMVMRGIYWDMYHLTLGVSMRKGNTLTTIGFNYALGFDKRDDNFIRFDRPETIYRDIYAEPIGMKSSIHALAIVIGFTYFSKRT